MTAAFALAVGVLASATAVGHLVASSAFSGIAAAAAVGTTIGATAAFGALRSSAIAWRSERDAEVAKADRLQRSLDTATQERHNLEGRIGVLEKSRDFEGALGAVVTALENMRTSSDSALGKVLDRLETLAASQHATTVAVEFLAKQLMPENGGSAPAPSSRTPARRRPR